MDKLAPPPVHTAACAAPPRPADSTSMGPHSDRLRLPAPHHPAVVLALVPRPAILMHHTEHAQVQPDTTARLASTGVDVRNPKMMDCVEWLGGLWCWGVEGTHPSSFPLLPRAQQYRRPPCRAVPPLPPDHDADDPGVTWCKGELPATGQLRERSSKHRRESPSLVSSSLSKLWSKKAVRSHRHQARAPGRKPGSGAGVWRLRKMGAPERAESGWPGEGGGRGGGGWWWGGPECVLGMGRGCRREKGRLWALGPVRGAQCGYTT